MAPRLRLMLAFGLLTLAILPLTGCGGASSDDDRVAGVIHRLLLAAGTEGTELLESFPGSLPDDLPVEPPIYPGAEILVSNRQPAPGADPTAPTAGDSQSILYFIVVDTADSRSDVFQYYQEALDESPWQIQSTFSTELLDTVQFFAPEDLDVGGVVSIAEGGQDDRTSVLISLQDTGASFDDVDFELPDSLALPGAFPPDVPIFEGSTITGTAFFREPTLQSFLVVYLTTSSADEVLDYYRDAFGDNGWTVEDSTDFGLEGQIDFREPNGDIQGDVFATEFVLDSDYTEVSIQVQLDPSREVAVPDDEGPAEEDTPSADSNGESG